VPASAAIARYGRWYARSVSVPSSVAQGERGELRQVDAVVEDEDGLDPSVAEEPAAVEPGDLTAHRGRAVGSARAAVAR